jgi:hypothetical protein
MLEKKDKLDRFLDDALVSNSEEIARDGLEQRILANLQAQPAPRSWRWLWVAIPALAAIVLAILLIGSRTPSERQQVVQAPPAQRHAPAQGQNSSLKQTPAPLPQVASGPRIARQHLGSRQTVAAVKKEPEPRMVTFPSGDANDELVKLAVRFAQAHPDEAREIAQEQQQFRELAAAFTAPQEDNR